MMELKPCPFCGGSARFVELRYDKYSAGFVKCNKKGIACCEQSVVQTREKAVEAWNRRVSE